MKVLQARSKDLRARKVNQLGELVITCGGDTMSIDGLAGLLLSASDADTASQEAWRQRGAAFFRKPRGAAKRTDETRDRTQPHERPDAAAAVEPGAA
jgi:phosphoribosylformylglycinamidine (FGAM) synthase-like enzyme